MNGLDESNPPVESFPSLYDELSHSGITDGDVCVGDDETGWCISAYRNGNIVFGQAGDPSTERHMKNVPKERVIEYWNRLVAGDIEGLLAEPWEPGYP